MSEDAPAVCETCLGPNPYLRMTREKNGLECKLCTRPFDVYKWFPIKNGSVKKTIICTTCSKQRNCCQSCLMDLTYGIPIQLRDAALKMAGVENISNQEPQNEISKLYVANNLEQFPKIGGASITSDSDKAREILTKLSMASKNKIAPKSIKNESLPSHINKIDVTKIISKLPLNGSTTPPNDTSITTIFIFGIDDSLPEYKITDFFENLNLKIKNFNCQHKSKAGFLTFQTRSDAEKAMSQIQSPQPGKPGLLVIENIPLRITWGKERSLGNSNLEKLKIGSIISKFIKKLSTNGDNKSSLSLQIENGNKDSNKINNKKKQKIETSKSYKALSKDFEL
ncbi:Zinc finger CCCH domain-containing protein 49 [Wickerhamomyces ciferrii]|uniref:Pre-mRNA-splicing factor SLT11 n=1 Tax=Wickerhamomyces ciferrii (strain ATCC 14091 / BCRC 22168 / CBS 111 / JCM 3599 / NBRC 0793 / NRRL Y-1031 F-60-10) TaxID=1206466 RepID=K0KQ57_WICCF|nr:Zinc finger CCCH domain-containing protein 49 [Wickerhamomyces ciferrii]CCH44282.1 Zinc finger CCCH domain-containing protein 49 [Wickerhamomyces ciferrii]